MQGPWQAFTYTVPNADGTTTGVLVTFEQAPISFEYLRTAVRAGLNFIEVVDLVQQRQQSPLCVHGQPRTTPAAFRP
jgi:hypothetical protein